MAHPSDKVLSHMYDNTFGCDPIKVTKNDMCEGCIKGKMHSKSYPSSESRSTEPLELIHADLMEMPMVSYHKNKWCLVIVDDYSSHVTISALRSKSDTYEQMQHYVTMMENQYNTKIKRFRSDRGGEFKSHAFESYLKEKGILHESTAPYTSQQNGRAERMNRTLREKAESMRHQAGLPDSWWEFAVETAAHVYNRTPLERTKWKTPFQNIGGKQPNVNYFRTFGCLAWVWTPEEIRKNKLEPRAQPMTFIGYVQGTKGWRFMRKDNTILIATNAKFNEIVFPRKDSSKNTQTTPSPPRYTSWDSEDSDDEDDNNNSPHQRSVTKPDKQKETDHHEEDQPDTQDKSQYLSGDNDDNSEHKEPKVQRDKEPKTPAKQSLPKAKTSKQKPVESTPPPLRRSSRTKKPVKMKDSAYGSKKATEILREEEEIEKDLLAESSDSDNLPLPGSLMMILKQIVGELGNQAVRLLLSKAVKVDELCPVTYKDADNSDQRYDWHKAMQEEIKALDDRSVWELVDCPNNRKPIKCRWVYSIKSDGRKRARLVAKGFSQIHGIDFDDTFSPVARFETVRLLLATAALDDWEIEALDVKTAFLYGALDEELYMDQPQGFIKAGQEGKVYRLKKALYGLKQASLAWNKAANQSLEQLGFKRLISDAGIYTLQNDKEIIIVILYVDDVLFMGNNYKLLMEKKKLFMKKWECRDLGPISEYLGMKIYRDRKNKSLSIDQIDYAKKVVKRFGQEDCHDVQTPLPGGYKPES